MKIIFSNGYETYDFPSSKFGARASYGGRRYADQPIRKTPIIFIHGNSDGALASTAENDGDSSNDGWSTSIDEFLRNGYTSAELYALTYGDRQIKHALNREMDCKTVIRIRRFIDAVLEYTMAEQVDIIAHSMGVSLARRVIKGGLVHEGRENSEEGLTHVCYIGQSIQKRVHTLIGIAGANYGMCMCADEQFARNAPACGKMVIFYLNFFLNYFILEWILGRR